MSMTDEQRGAEAIRFIARVQASLAQLGVVVDRVKLLAPAQTGDPVPVTLEVRIIPPEPQPVGVDLKPWPNSPTRRSTASEASWHGWVDGTVRPVHDCGRAQPHHPRVVIYFDGTWQMSIVTSSGYDNLTAEEDIEHCPFCGVKLEAPAASADAGRAEMMARFAEAARAHAEGRLKEFLDERVPTHPPLAASNANDTIRLFRRTDTSWTSTLHCPCGEAFVWVSVDEGLAEWLDQHCSHVAPRPTPTATP